MELNLRGYIIGSIISSGIFGWLVGSFQAGSCASRLQATTAATVPEDLNKDGIPDLVLQQLGGYKTPLYGVRDASSPSVSYVSASEMKRRNPNSSTDYRTIEAKLNQ